MNINPQIMSTPQPNSSIEHCITIVGFLKANNGRSYEQHECCGTELVLDHNDSVGLKLCLHLTERHDLAAHHIHHNGSDCMSCRICFLIEYAVGEVDRTIVCLREIFTAESENTYQMRLFHQKLWLCHC